MCSKPSLGGSLQQVNISPTERTLMWHNLCESRDIVMLTGLYAGWAFCTEKQYVTGLWVGEQASIYTNYG